MTRSMMWAQRMCGQVCVCPPYHLSSHSSMRVFCIVEAWLWSPKTSSWRYELHAGHGWVPLAGKPTFKFAHGVLRASNENMGC
mmetsp:Transcript_30532/g.70002  ORF Transcript_30532/g.70002 Transcript_30532/m.70002 type:complete len:83 (+) Transcript_30532:772-1020(+)